MDSSITSNQNEDFVMHDILRSSSSIGGVDVKMPHIDINNKIFLNDVAERLAVALINKYKNATEEKGMLAGVFLQLFNDNDIVYISNSMGVPVDKVRLWENRLKNDPLSKKIVLGLVGITEAQLQKKGEFHFG